MGSVPAVGGAAVLADEVRVVTGDHSSRALEATAGFALSGLRNHWDVLG